jgi:hypothetical protein
MNCPGCGAENPEDATFCQLCLQKFTSEPNSGRQAAGARADQLPPETFSGAGPLPLAPPGTRAAKPAGLKGRLSGKAWIGIGIGVALLLIAVVCALVFIPGTGRHSPHPRTASVLFIGNSYTFVNDLPGTFASLASSLGNHITVDSSAKAGFLLSQHAVQQDTLAKIASKKWDYVVLQEQSQMPLNDTGITARLMTPYARQLDSLVHQANPAAKTVLFETWARRDGDYAGNQAKIDATYGGLATTLGATVAPVGVAWSSVRRSDPDLQLYSQDGSHPSVQGTYLAACVFCDVICGDRSAGASALSVDAAQAKILQEAADRAVNTAPVP